MGLESVGGEGGGGFDYVQDAEPSGAVEGEEWYDTGADSAYVYDGSGWIEETVVEHAALSGVSPGDHHSRYSDSEARNAVRLRGSYADSSLSGDGDSATIYQNNTVPWRLSVTVSSGGSFSQKTETTATLVFADGTTSTYTATISGGDYGNAETTKNAPLWPDFENGKRLDRIDCDFVQDPSDNANGNVSIHALEVF